ncbi:MAG: four helix bundle protein [Bacteroidales bacterium]|nr:four helix bundle protein [Bacteroidales bacterium]
MAFFEDLGVWQKAKDMVLNIYQTLDYGHDFGFKDQIQRAAVSIMNNIAEGSEAGTVSSYIHFLHIAKGSCAEVRSMLHLCNDLGYCNKGQADELITQCRQITAALNKLITYLETKK